jgi:hypothetical protein
MQQVGSSPSRRQRLEGGLQCRVLGQPGLKFLRNRLFGNLFVRHFQAGLFHLDGFADIGFQGAFQYGNLLDAGEASLAHRLRILAGRGQDAFAVFQQGSLEKAEQAVIPESADYHNIAVLERITRLMPL